jgi:hypothetical protein
MAKTITDKVTVSLPNNKGTTVEVTVPEGRGQRGLEDKAKKQADADPSCQSKVNVWWKNS